MIDWKAKLTSRKLWMALIGFLTGLLTYLGVGTEQAEQIGSIVLMGASVVAYIIGEGLADAAGAASDVPVSILAEAMNREGKPTEDQNDNSVEASN